jgi:hypothetical protein
MRDDRTSPAPASPASDRSTTDGVDQLRTEREPLKQEGDALRDGSGSRQGQSPPNVGPRESR